jgi:prophage tail gpP-like protein
MADIQLHIDNLIYTGWKTFSFTDSLEAAATTFTVGISANVDGDTSILPVYPGTACQLSLNGHVVLSGFVDGVSGKYDDKSHDYNLVGRSNVGDLIDCSAIIKGGVFRNQTISQIAKALCEPFNVPVELQANEGAALKQHRTEDASVHEVIERACRRRGLLLSSSPQGGLIIGEVGSDEISTPLVRGDNIKGGSGRFTQNERFSHYIVKGQTDDGGAGWELSQQIQAKGEALDPSVNRYRPLILDAEDGETDFSTRARFEANTRLARSTQITYTVQGWEHDAGLWEKNKLVRVVDSYFGIDSWLLISDLVFTLDENGTKTDITVIPKEAFTVEVLKEKVSGASKKGTTGGWANVLIENPT